MNSISRNGKSGIRVQSLKPKTQSQTPVIFYFGL